jgi:hypothetical protein
MKKRLLIPVLIVLSLIASTLWAAELLNITTAGVDGNWVIYDGSKNIICTFDATNRKLSFPSGAIVDIESGGYFKLSGTAVTTTAAELNALAGTGLSAAELGVLNGVTAGTTTASKAVVLGADSKIDTIDITSLKIGGTAVSATAAQLNYVSGVTAGTSTASKAVVLGADSKIDTIDITSLKIGGTGVTSTAGQLNFLSGVTAGTSTASKAVVLGADSKIDTIDITSLKIAGTTITATPTQINRAGIQYYNAGTTTASANTDKSGYLILYSGSVPISSGTSVVVSGFSPAYSGTDTFSCIVTGETDSIWKCNRTSTSSITISTTTATSDTVQYGLMGY